MKRRHGGASLDPAHGVGILAELAQEGPLTLPEIPHRWPFVRPMLERQVRRFVAEGLVERVPSRKVAGKTAYSLTRQGRATLASWSGR